MSGRRQARTRAIEILFEAWQRETPVPDILMARISDPSQEQPITSFAQEIVLGVHEHHDQLIELLNTYSTGWQYQRMPMVDRAILCVGAWEILYATDIDDAVSIAEAVKLAERLSTDKSPKFINGLLAKLSSQKDTLLL